MCRAGMRIVFAGLLACAILAPAAPARSTVYCDVRRTRDELAALRAAPDVRARRVGRMRFVDEVQLHTEVGPRGGYVFVTWWRGGRFKGTGHVGDDPPDGHGWVLRRAIAEECG